MMYNCRFFPDEIAGGREYNGICHNILNYFSNGIGPHKAEYHLGAAGDPRHRYNVCEEGDEQWFDVVDQFGVTRQFYHSWAQQCIAESDVLNSIYSTTTEHGNENWLSCDEFPWNTMEDGGNPASNSRSCVPGYQQNMQGHLNNLLNKMRQTVSYINSKGVKDHKEHMPWGGKGADWETAQGPQGGGTTVNKDRYWNWAQDNKKLFTFHLFNSDTTLTPELDQYQVFNHELIPGQGDQDDWYWIAGAVNTFGNPKYKISHNAWCVNLKDSAQYGRDPYYYHPVWKGADERYVSLKL
jgi:hypothetical protein